MAMKRYNPGDPLRIPAADLNLIADVIEGVAPGMSSPSLGGASSPCVVRVRNMTGVTLPAFAVIAIGTPRVSPSSNAEAFKRFPVFSAIIPDEGQTTGLAILQRKLADGETGLAVVAGGSPVRCNVVDIDHPCAAPDGLGGILSAEGGPISLVWKASIGYSAWCYAVIGAASSAPMGDNDYYKGYFKLSIVEKTRPVESSVSESEGDKSASEEYETYYEAHHSGGRWTINGQLGTLLAGDVPGDLSYTLQDIILHYHVNSGDPEDLVESGIYVERAPLQSNDEYNAYWLLGQMSIDEVIQQSHGVPAMILAACREEEEDASVSESESASEEPAQ